ncbi:sialidase family protein [Thiobacillus sp. 63-78]|uniref:sialidase family protein n=1 Tax=Thiobacillus sp. 63-78 TaxID=1895859 RepID=UPI000A476B5C|nr:sialidase family protein [Thiobacillus sp. 63-78]
MDRMNTVPAGCRNLARAAALLLLSGSAGTALSHEHAPLPNQGQAASAPSAKPSLAVSATVDARGRIWLARVENRTILVAYSADAGQSFSVPVAVNPQPENIGAEGENRPKIAVTRHGTLHLSWTQLLSKPYTGEIRYARSTDDGKTFSTPITLNDDGRLTSHRFDSLVSDGGDRLAIAWLDGRDRDAAQEQGNTFAGVSVYFARSDDNGASFQANRKLTEHTCECCRTALAWTTAGPAALWRNLYGTHTRDFALALLDSGRLQRLADDEWNIDACPHHGGGLATGGDDTLHAVWYTQGKNRQGLFYRQVKGDQMSAPMAFGDPRAQAGHATVAAEGQTVLITWREFDGKVYGAMTLLSRDGGAHWSAPRRMATTANAADYPIPLIHNGRTQIVWNTLQEGVRIMEVE